MHSHGDHWTVCSQKNDGWYRVRYYGLPGVACKYGDHWSVIYLSDRPPGMATYACVWAGKHAHETFLDVYDKLAIWETPDAADGELKLVDPRVLTGALPHAEPEKPHGPLTYTVEKGG